MLSGIQITVLSVALLGAVLVAMFAIVFHRNGEDIFGTLTANTKRLLDLSPLERIRQVADSTALQRTEWLDFQVHPWSADMQAVEVSLDLRDLVPDSVQLVSLQTGEPSPRWLRGSRVPTHDLSFDRCFEVRGDPLSVHVMLGKTARNQLAMLMERGPYGCWQDVWLDRGMLSARLLLDHGTEHLQPAQFSKLIQDLIHVAASLSFSTPTIPTRLCQEVNKLQSNLYRAWCVSHLLDHWPQAPETLDTLDMCRHHGVCELQLVAFEFSPEDFSDEERYRLMLAVSAGHADHRIRENALKVLVEDYLDSVFFDGEVPLFQRLLVVATLTRQLPASDAEELLMRVYDNLEDRDRREFSRQLSEVRWRASSAFLTREAKRAHTKEKTLLALCEWCEIHSPEIQEEIALTILDHQRSTKARQVAIRSLAQHGGLGAIATLGRIRQTSGSAAQNELARMASDAITTIQARVGEPVRGAMTLITADDAHGQLSLVQEAGGLTPVEEEISHG